jgi:glyceraldehyde-3-phosphate dehydrogenase/erythrose-4-phosphate dehydrogenase
MGALPRLVFSLDVTTSAQGRGTTVRVTKDGKHIIDATHHPILKDTHAFVNLITLNSKAASSLLTSTMYKT